MATIIPREDWGAPADRSHLPGLSGSAGFGVHYNGPRMVLRRHDDCYAAVAGIRRFHVHTRGWLDIAYNFLACPHGYLFEGRGWDRRSAANGTNEGNGWGHAVMGLLGAGQDPPHEMLAAVSDLARRHDTRYGRVSLRPHSAFKATECPGDPLRAWVASGEWRQWEDDMALSDSEVDRIADTVVAKLLAAEVAVYHGPDAGEAFPLERLIRRDYQQQGRFIAAFGEFLEEWRAEHNAAPVEAGGPPDPAG